MKNAVERVREYFLEDHGECDEGYTDCEMSYLDALDDVQREFNNDVSRNWERECSNLRKEIEKLTIAYKDECERTSHYATTIMEQNKEIMLKDRKLNELNTKWGVVELIFGGK